MLKYIESKNCFSKKECDFLLKKYKKTKWKTHQWYSPKEGFLKPKKNHKELLVANIEREDGEFIINKLQPFVLNYLKKHNLDLSAITKFSNIRLNKYPKNSMMLSHVDHIQTLFDGTQKGIPVLSIIGVLNDDFKGGEFFIRKKEFKLNKGDVIIFPSIFIFPHEVKKILKKERYSFVLWAY
tara:strand:- start:159 stop:704 length:546 start_codon:yes stop_codon:yes gene_type:complete